MQETEYRSVEQPQNSAEVNLVLLVFRVLLNATDGCQSNCVLNPAPPAGGSSIGIIDNKVIGYYESWSAGLSCHQVAPTDLPLDALTQ
jgi:hypothetical protein